MHNRSKFLYSFSIALLSILIDQLSKYFVENNLEIFINGLVILEGVNLVYVQNKGISFGMLSNFNITFFLGLLSLIISCYIFFLIFKSDDQLEFAGLSLILGGALGNGFDRLKNGYVIDFIDIYYNNLHWPAFNFADSFITIGAILFYCIFVKK